MPEMNKNDGNAKGQSSLTDLEQRLRAAVKESLTPEEIRQQSISFTMGMLSPDSTTTRDYVEKLVSSQYG